MPERSGSLHPPIHFRQLWIVLEGKRRDGGMFTSDERGWGPVEFRPPESIAHIQSGRHHDRTGLWEQRPDRFFTADLGEELEAETTRCRREESVSDDVHETPRNVDDALRF